LTFSTGHAIFLCQIARADRRVAGTRAAGDQKTGSSPDVPSNSLNIPTKYSFVGARFGQRLSPVFLGVSQNHFAHGVNAMAFKHVLGAAQANANAPKAWRGRLFRRVGVGPDT